MPEASRCGCSKRRAAGAGNEAVLSVPCAACTKVLPRPFPQSAARTRAESCASPSGAWRGLLTWAVEPGRGWQSRRARSWASTRGTLRYFRGRWRPRTVPDGRVGLRWCAALGEAPPVAPRAKRKLWSVAATVSERAQATRGSFAALASGVKLGVYARSTADDAFVLVRHAPGLPRECMRVRSTARGLRDGPPRQRGPPAKRDVTNGDKKLHCFACGCLSARSR